MLRIRFVLDRAWCRTDEGNCFLWVPRLPDDHLHDPWLFSQSSLAILFLLFSLCNDDINSVTFSRCYSREANKNLQSHNSMGRTLEVQSLTQSSAALG